jgi:hypothetical protein
MKKDANKIDGRVDFFSVKGMDDFIYNFQKDLSQVKRA